MKQRDWQIVANDILGQLQVEYLAWSFGTVYQSESHTFLVEFSHRYHDNLKGSITFPAELGRNEIIQCLCVLLYRSDLAASFLLT